MYATKETNYSDDSSDRKKNVKGRNLLQNHAWPEMVAAFSHTYAACCLLPAPSASCSQQYWFAFMMTGPVSVPGSSPSHQCP